ncbi:MAG: hypothetical protein LQ342_006117 [Letrouitia transgressa]|nr:MAG: hypothetical protein LQ342_006117 [Letrouitia transgressa]
MNQSRIFAAVFAPSTVASIPTPAATPDLGSAEFEIPGIESGAPEQIQWDRAWHTATTFLSLPKEPTPTILDEEGVELLNGKWYKQCNAETIRAIRYLVARDSPGYRLRRYQKQDDLLQWYFEEVGQRHFMTYVRPTVLESIRDGNFAYALSDVLRYLNAAEFIYMHNLERYILPILPNNGKPERDQFLSRLQGLFAYSLPQQKIGEYIGEFLRQHAKGTLGLVGQSFAEKKVAALRENTRQVVSRLQATGLGGPQFQQRFAEVMSEMLLLHIEQTYSGQWSSPSNVIDHLRDWVENHFARFIVEVLASLATGPTPQAKNDTHVSLADVEKWQEMAINRLGGLRTDELFNVIVEWENDSKGAIEDLKRYVTTTTSRTHLTTSFSEVVSRRLLQPGAATTEILQMYISIIRAFTLLDPKGVLLDRVARPIRRYLRDRDDSVTIVVGSLLADPEDESADADILIDLAIEMNMTTTLLEGDEDDDGELDWDDMDWMPDPIDAGPDYKKPKRLDIIGSLISLFDTKDIFVKEFQNVLGERLLKKDYKFDKEIRVLELLKHRFGEPALQACEIMLRDIVDSRRVDTVICHDQNLQTGTFDNSTASSEPKLHARILSHLFWPSLHSENFNLPPQISALQARYATGFETLKQSRKLTWLNALGQATVHLELEDRVVVEDVQTWQAAVIYAFQTDDGNDTETMDVEATPVTKTVPQLSAELEMSESLVVNALTFWVGKLVLREVAPGAYQVLETLSPTDLDSSFSDPSHVGHSTVAAAAAAAATSAPAPAVRSEEEVMMEKMEVFWHFVLGMLTNQGPMPLQRIVMMLKVVVPGGFPFGNEELKEFLEGRVKEGKLEVAGGNYKIKS